MVHCHTCGTVLKGTERACPVCGMPQSNPHLQSGTKLKGGRYSVGRVLGQGGFGITYQGADLSVNQPVAIKEFFPDGSSRHSGLLVPPTSLGQQGLRGALDNFLEEARTLARFNHPSIVDVKDVFEENYTAYLVMELLQGDTLGKRIADAGALPAAEVTSLALRLAEALAVVHETGLLHRDIKPDNIFLTTDGRTVLIDFGSARAYASGQTVSHTRLVTPGYAPLEQYTSQARFGPYTDIYALAATLYHAASGTQPPPATDRLAGTELEPLPAHLPAGLRAAIMQGLEVRIDERPATAEDFVRLLREEVRPRRAPLAPSPGPRVPDTREGQRYDVILEDSGLLRLFILAQIRNLTGAGYREAARLAEEGGVMMSGLSRAEAERVRLQFEAMGAAVTVAPTGTRGGTPRVRPPSPRPQPLAWQSYGCCSGWGLGCLFLLLFFWLMSTGGFIFFL